MLPLPSNSTPLYNLTIPSTKKKIKFRPFLVKEEKALLLAEQSEDIDTMISTLKKIIDDCTLNKIDVDTLAIFDLEYILLKLRTKSVGEIAELNIPCKKCRELTTVKLDVSTLEVTRNPEHKNKIHLFDDEKLGPVGVVMKYPSINILHGLDNNPEPEVIFDAAINCIDYIYDSKNVHYTKDRTKEELTNFLDGLSGEQFDRIKKFFETMPKMEVNLQFKCNSCGHDNERVLEGIHNFF